MAELINLRQVRKRKRRSGKEDAAAANRIAHGRSASEKSSTRLVRGLQEKRIEGHRRVHAAEADREDGD